MAYRKPQNSNGINPVTVVIIGAGVILLPKILKIIGDVGGAGSNVIETVTGAINTITGNGTIKTQPQQTTNSISKNIASIRLTPTNQDLIDAQYIFDRFDDFKLSLSSSKTPFDSQIKILNRLGIAVNDGLTVYHTDGSKTKYLTESGAKTAANYFMVKQLDYKRVARIVKAYGVKETSNRHTPFIGLLFENDKGTLIEHFSRYMSDDFVNRYLPFIQYAIK